MKTDDYLYGCNRKPLKSIVEIADDRITSAKEVLDSLLTEPIETRDFQRINDILKAIEFYENWKQEEINNGLI